MATYYVNKNAQSNGDHEVHKSNCSWLPDESNRMYLGTFDKCSDAVKKAKETYKNSDGCAYCSPECHTS